MANQFELSAELRSDLGKGASRRLRRNNQVPAIMYGAEKEPVSITLQHHHILKALENEAFYSHILTIALNGEKHQAVLKGLQRHPYKPKVLHMDFLRINPKEKLTMHVPLHFIGEASAPGLKDGGVFMHLLNNVEIRCLPADLPEYIEVDVSQLKLDQMLHLSDIKLPKGVELTAFTHGSDEDHNVGVVKIHIPRAAAAEETPAAETTAAATPAPAAKTEAKDSKK